MITRNLARRLENLETQFVPPEPKKFIRVLAVTSEGEITDTLTFEIAQGGVQSRPRWRENRRPFANRR
ncbi:MAG: hypothetical protein ABI824_12225 [Acidobacteriota bacterium]